VTSSGTSDLARQHFADLALHPGAGKDHVAGFVLGGKAIVGDHVVAYRLVVEFAPARARCAHRMHQGAGLEPAPHQHRRAGIGHRHHDVGIAHRGFGIRAGAAVYVGGAALGIGPGRAPDPDVAQWHHGCQRQRMTARQRPRAEDREPLGPLVAQGACRHGRNRGGAQLGQPGRIHHGQRHAGRGVEQQQGGDHGRQAARGVARHLGDQLGRQRVGGQRRLDEEQAAGLGQFHHGA
jgi:hypothetical protein